MTARSLRSLPRWIGGHWKMFFLIGVVLGLALGFAWQGRERAPTRVEHLASLRSERVELVRREPARVREVYAECREELAADLGRPFADLTEDDRQLVFCMVMSYSLAPYGKSDAILLNDMLASPKLHCGNYPLLMAELHRFFPSSEATPVCLVGWSYGPHGMAYRPHADENRSLFLDPTVALLVRGSFDEVAGGRPIDRKRLVSFSHRDETTVSRDFVANTFVEGKYRPSHLLYYYENLEHYSLRRGNMKDWPTPGAADQRANEASGAKP